MIMNKAQEILNECTNIYKKDATTIFIERTLLGAMKAYAEWYAKQCLEIVCEEVKFHRLAHGEIQIDKDSILNITLPNHNDL